MHSVSFLLLIGSVLALSASSVGKACVDSNDVNVEFDTVSTNITDGSPSVTLMVVEKPVYRNHSVASLYQKGTASSTNGSDGDVSMSVEVVKPAHGTFTTQTVPKISAAAKEALDLPTVSVKRKTPVNPVIETMLTRVPALKLINTEQWPAPLTPITQCTKPGLFALTLDDGPNEQTVQVLDVLKQKGVQATFFVLGSMVAEQPGNMIRAFQEGHQIALHSFSHTDFPTLTRSQVLDEMQQSFEVVYASIQKLPRFFRFPSGSYNQPLLNVMNQLNMAVSQWNLDTNDWFVRNPDSIVQNVDQALNGASAQRDSFVALAHDIHDFTVASIEQIVNTVLAKGFRFVTLSECIGLPPYF